MAENKALNEEALVEMAHTMGFDLAHACAAAALSWYTMKKTKNRS